MRRQQTQERDRTVFLLVSQTFALVVSFRPRWSLFTLCGVRGNKFNQSQVNLAVIKANMYTNKHTLLILKMTAQINHYHAYLAIFQLSCMTVQVCVAGFLITINTNHLRISQWFSHMFLMCLFQHEICCSFRNFDQ